MKRVLIISPYFPPTNAADMQRVRMSLPFYKEFGWEAEVVVVDPRFSDMATDPLLAQSIPATIRVHLVKALSKKWTSKIGLGSIAIRSFLFYRQTVNRLLVQNHYDLIYFSTTQFPVCVLGRYWKARFKTPFVIDVQDPWHSDYYKNKPGAERPPKYWFSYWLNKTLEPLAMKKVDGLIAVSEGYLKTLSGRYPHCSQIPRNTIPFGVFEADFEIAKQNRLEQPSVLTHTNDKINIVYIGRGGQDMQNAVSCLFQAFSSGLMERREAFKKIHFYFIGTSYATAGEGNATIAPLAESYGLGAYVTEITDRIPFYQTLNTLQDADALFVPGSNDPQYTASKIYPYVMVNKPLLALFHPDSSVVSFLNACKVGTVVTFDKQPEEIREGIKDFLVRLTENKSFATEPDKKVFNSYSAKEMTKRQALLFDEIA